MFRRNTSFIINEASGSNRPMKPEALNSHSFQTESHVEGLTFASVVSSRKGTCIKMWFYILWPLNLKQVYLYIIHIYIYTHTYIYNYMYTIMYIYIYRCISICINYYAYINPLRSSEGCVSACPSSRTWRGWVSLKLFTFSRKKVVWIWSFLSFLDKGLFNDRLG